MKKKEKRNMIASHPSAGAALKYIKGLGREKLQGYMKMYSELAAKINSYPAELNATILDFVMKEKRLDAHLILGLAFDLMQLEGNLQTRVLEKVMDIVDEGGSIEDVKKLPGGM